jgi:hypothetical protein
MLSMLLKRVHTLIFGFLLIFSDLFSILIVLLTSTFRGDGHSSWKLVAMFLVHGISYATNFPTKSKSLRLKW